MGFMEKWKDWSQRQWDKWGSKLQPAADRIRAWGFTEEQNAALAAILSALPEKVQKFLYKVLEILYRYTLKKYGAEAVMKACEKLIEFFETFLDLFKRDNE